MTDHHDDFSGLMVATDLDGTLLDHDSYDVAPALPVLARLKAGGAMIVLVTSKTAAEVRDIGAAIGVKGPYVVENGAAIVHPDGRYDLLGTTRAEIARHVAQLRTNPAYVFETFADMGADRIAELTGLPPADAEKAATRLASEPLLWQGTPKARDTFVVAARQAGLTVLIGGRFMHLGGDTNKGAALQKVVRANPGHASVLVALGDSQNDAAMLAVADCPVWIRRPSGPTPEASLGPLARCSLARGPLGWAEAMTDFLDREWPYFGRERQRGDL